MSRAIPQGKQQPPLMLSLQKGGISLAEEVKRRSGTDLQRCFQCHTCANGCPFLQAMDYPPNAVLRLLQFGLRREALGCSTIWICVGCHTCSSQCPMDIDIAAVMDTLRLLALEEGVVLGKPNIYGFHAEVLRSLEKYGRAHKLSIMLRYKLLTMSWFRDLDVGLKMLAKRKLEIVPSRIRAMGELAGLFEDQARKSP